MASDRISGTGSGQKVDPVARAMSGFRLGNRPVLDGVRGLAVLLVVLHHTTTIAPRGYAGVDLFFVLSGFLITSLLDEEFERSGRIALRRFYLRRALRLEPALAALLLAVAVWVLSQPASYAAGPTGRALLPTIFYVSNWTSAAGADSGLLGHTWSLAIEEQFYLFWPLFLMLALRSGGRRTAFWLCMAGIAAAVLMRYVLASGGGGLNQIYNGFECRWDSLLLGAGLALLLHARRTRAPAAAAILAPLGLVALVFLVVTPGDMAVGIGGPGLASAGIVATLVMVRVPLLTRLFESVALRALGRVSYGVYLWHYPVAVVLQHTLGIGRGWLLLAGDFAVTVALASASYRWIESPFRRMRSRLAHEVPAAAGRTPLGDGFVAVQAVE